jgi:di/tricarboxylate transporter
MITTVQAVSIWNVGIKTAAAQNMVAIGFIQKLLGPDVTWLSWLIAAAPFSFLVSVGLYGTMMLMMPPEMKEIPGDEATVRKSLSELGPMTGREARLLAVSLSFCCAFGQPKGYCIGSIVRRRRRSRSRFCVCPGSA